MAANRTLQTLQFIERYIRRNGYAPSVRDIRDGLTMSNESVVHYHLMKLRKRGVITWDDGVARSIRLCGEVKA